MIVFVKCPPPLLCVEGAAEAREKNKPPPPAGYGYAAYQHGREMFRAAGQIVARVTPNVKTTTRNLADLVAFTRALQWARSYALSQGRAGLCTVLFGVRGTHSDRRMEG